MSNIPVWKGKGKKYLSRKVDNRGYPKPAFLIICEGEKTEPNYFKSFPVTSATIVVFGEGRNTRSLVEQAIEHVKDAKKSGYNFNQVWCVFDKDSFSSGDFNGAIEMAESKGYKVAYSNQAFEIWYALHFDYISASLHRKDIVKRLKKKLSKPYKKNSTDMYEILLRKQPDAIRNAKKLLNSYKSKNPAQNDPSTTVHKLVEELNKFLRP